MAIALPDTVTDIAFAQAEGNRYEAIHIANALFSIPVRTDDQDQLAFGVMRCNSPLMSFHKVRSRKKSHSQMEH